MTDNQEIYTGTLVEKYGGNLDKGEVGTVIAIAIAVKGEKIYKVLANGEEKDWYGEFVRRVQKNDA